MLMVIHTAKKKAVFREVLRSLSLPQKILIR